MVQLNSQGLSLKSGVLPYAGTKVSDEENDFFLGRPTGTFESSLLDVKRVRERQIIYVDSERSRINTHGG